MSVEVGLKGEATVVVNEQNIAKTMKSGALEVFATLCYAGYVRTYGRGGCCCVNRQITDR